jgi:hypothetical protein
MMQGASNDYRVSEILWELEGEDAAEVVTSRGSAGFLGQWLATHGACVTQLSFKAPDVEPSSPPDVEPSSPPDALPRLQLPFAQLQQLRNFTCCNAQLQDTQLGSDSTAGQQQQHCQDMERAVQKAPNHTAAAAYASSGSSSSSGSVSAMLLQASLPSLTKLTSLQLRGVNYCCRGGLAALSAFTGLQQLQLLEVPEQDAEQQAAAHDHPHQLDYLPLLTQLSRLHLDTNLLPQGAVGVFSGLQRLQELRLDGTVLNSLDVLQGLPPSVAKLQLFVDLQTQFSISTVPALAQLTALQLLEVGDNVPAYSPPDVNPGSISFDFLLSLKHPEQLRVLDLDGSMGSNTAATLLSAVQRLSNLVHLRLCTFDMSEVGNAEHVSALTGYSALLPPGPHLTCFSLTSNRAWILLAGCGTHMFGATRQLPQLKVFELGAFNEESVLKDPSDQFLYYDEAGHRGFDTPAACFGPGDVERLVCCCPGLERLWMPGLVQAGVDVSPLLRLTALTGLFVGGEVWCDDVAVSVLAGMTGLQELQLCDAPGFTDNGLLALSALTGLTKLGVLSCQLSTALPTFFNGRETTDEDEVEGCFLLWKQVCGLSKHVCCFAVEVNSRDRSLGKKLKILHMLHVSAPSYTCLCNITMVLCLCLHAALTYAHSALMFAGPPSCCVAAAAAAAVRMHRCGGLPAASTDAFSSTHCRYVA